MYNGDKDKIGYSVFHINEEVDAGDLIFQEKIDVSKDDSYMSVDWKSMKLIAIKQAQIIKKYESNNIIEKKKHEKIPENSEHPIPGLSHYLDFLKKK